MLILTIKTGEGIMSKKVTGTCALCGKTIKLSFEHIPPRKFDNDEKVNIYHGDAFFRKNTKYSQEQKGFGLYSLCESCNSLTGSWYNKAFLDFANHIYEITPQILTTADNYIKCNNVYPNQVIKQILSWFCSVNNDDLRIDGLRKFVLDKKSVGINQERFKLLIEFTDIEYIICHGFSEIVCSSDNRIATEIFSEVVFPPFDFRLILNPNKSVDYWGDITSFSNYEYDESDNILIPIKVKHEKDFPYLDFKDCDLGE